MYGIMAVHEGHAYIGMVEGLPREISEVIHHTYRCIGFSRTASEHKASPTTLHPDDQSGSKQCDHGLTILYVHVP